MEGQAFGTGNEERAMEGRQFDKDGKDLGDADFHETGFGFSGEKEKKTLDELAGNLVELELQQVKNIAGNDSALGAKAYQQLLKRHPEDKRADEWREMLAKLEGEEK